jgi:hypothetical protein
MPKTPVRPRRYRYADYAGDETILGYFWRDWRLAKTPPDLDILTEDEFKVYHRRLAAAERINDTYVEIRWVVPRGEPDAAPSLAYCVPSSFYQDDDYIVIDAAEIASFMKIARKLVAERVKKRRRRKPRHRASGPLVFAVFPQGVL